MTIATGVSITLAGLLPQRSGAFGQQAFKAVLPRTSALSRPDQVKFGANQYPKLAYDFVETITDPLFGKIDKYRFSNGMELFALQRPDVPLISFGTFIKTGVINEDFRNNGVSHFLEHLLFKGSPEYGPGVLDCKLEELGAGINAWTSWDGTFYYLYEMPSEHLKAAIPLHADMMQNALIPPTDLELERGVVISEIDMYANKPASVAGEMLLDATWDDHAYSMRILGPKENIRELSRKDILTYYAKHYGPENRKVVAVGDFDIHEVLETMATSYNQPFPPKGGEKPGEERIYHSFLDRMPTRALPPTIASTGAPAEQTLYREVKNGMMLMGINGPVPGNPEAEKELLAMDLLTTILGGGESSRLYRTFVEEKKMASDIEFGVSRMKERSLIEVECSAEAQVLPALRNEISQFLAEVAVSGVTPEELEKAKIVLERALADATERQFNIMGPLVRSINQNTLGTTGLGKQLELAETLTCEDLRNVAKKYLKPDLIKVVTVLPKPAEAPPAENISPLPLQFGGKTTVKTAKASVQFSGSLTPLDQSAQLPGGTELIVRQDPKARNTAVTIRINKGGKRSESIPGESLFLAKMLDRGSDRLPASDFQKRLGDKEISLAISNTADSYVITMKSLSRFNDEMFAMLEEVLQGPTSNPDELEFVKTQYQKEYEDTLDQTPSQVAMLNLVQKLFPNHPIGVTGKTALTNMKAITNETLKTTFQRLFTRSNMTVSVVGNLPLETVKQKIETITSHLPDTPVTLGAFTAQAPAQNIIVTVAKDELKLAEIVRGWVGTGVNHEDRPALSMVSGIFSAGMSSRLIETFREGRRKGIGKPGLCYTVRASSVPSKEGGFFQFYIGTEPKNITTVQKMFQQELDEMMTTLSTEAELAKTKIQVRRALLASLQASHAISDETAGHRGLDYDSTLDLLQKLDAVTPQQVQAAAQKYLGKASVTSIYAPSKDLEANGLPINGVLVKP
jgi:zinc protease